jgi:hypothetical protein
VVWDPQDQEGDCAIKRSQGKRLWRKHKPMVDLTIDQGWQKTTKPTPPKPMVMAQGLTCENVLAAAEATPDDDSSARKNLEGHPPPCITFGDAVRGGKAANLETPATTKSQYIWLRTATLT